MSAVTQLAPTVGIQPACHALGVARGSFYRQRLQPAGALSCAIAPPRPSPARALSPSERAAVLAHLHQQRFHDHSPAAIYATLLDEGLYACSIRTMYRILESQGQNRERRDQLT